MPSICPLSARPVFIMKTIMVTTKKAAASMIQPSKMSWFHWVRESRMAIPILPTKAADQGGKDRFAQLGPPNLGQIGQGDADDERGFDPFAQSDDECLQHCGKLYCNSVATTRSAIPTVRIVSTGASVNRRVGQRLSLSKYRTGIALKDFIRGSGAHPYTVLDSCIVLAQILEARDDATSQILRTLPLQLLQESFYFFQLGKQLLFGLKFRRVYAPAAATQS